MALIGNCASQFSILLHYVAVFSANLKHWQMIQLGKKRKNAPNVRNLLSSAGVASQKSEGKGRLNFKSFETSVSAQKCTTY